MYADSIYIYISTMVTTMLLPPCWGFFTWAYYCHMCKKAYDHQEAHLCPNACWCCHFPDCPIVPWICCDDYNRMSQSQVCFDRHKQSSEKSICATIVRCSECHKVVKTRSKYAKNTFRQMTISVTCNRCETKSITLMSPEARMINYCFSTLRSTRKREPQAKFVHSSKRSR